MLQWFLCGLCSKAEKFVTVEACFAFKSFVAEQENNTFLRLASELLINRNVAFYMVKGAFL